MSPAERILVAGATWDYIDTLLIRFPDRVLFLTDFNERRACPLAPPPTGLEILCDFNDRERTLRLVREHLRRYSIRPSGIVAFDCEALGWTAGLARDLGLRFPGEEAVALVRDKVLCKKAWQKAGLRCPRAEKVSSPDEAKEFLRELGGPTVLKPLHGTGSSGVYKCVLPEEVDLYFPRSLECTRKFTPGAEMLCAEEALSGTEYSCDFILQNGQVTILRVAQKHFLPHERFGATLAYLVGPEMPLAGQNQALRDDLLTAMQTLGMDRAYGMADFFWLEGKPSFLEIAPRPGGDCLPWVLHLAGGLDTLETALDFSEGKSPSIPPADQWQPMAGLMLYAFPGGMVLPGRARQVLADPRVKELHLGQPDIAVVAPPRPPDEPTRLGHLIFSPHDPTCFGEEALELRQALFAGLEQVA